MKVALLFVPLIVFTILSILCFWIMNMTNNPVFAALSIAFIGGAMIYTAVAIAIDFDDSLENQKGETT